MRRNLGKIEEAPGLSWLRGHLDYSVAPLLDEPWCWTSTPRSSRCMASRRVPNSATIRTSPVGPWPSQGQACTAITPTCCRNLRLVLSVDVQPGDQHNSKHATGGLWSLLDRWDPGPLAEAAAR